MQNTKHPLLREYALWLFKQYQSLQQQPITDAYRIAAVCFNKDNSQCKLTIQVVGKNITFRCMPEEIVSDDQMMECFSRKDVRTITYYACQIIKKPKKRITFQACYSKLNRLIFGIEKHNHPILEKKTADQISLDNHLLGDLSQNDTHCVDYITACKPFTKDTGQIKNIHHQDSQEKE